MNFAGKPYVHRTGDGHWGIRSGVFPIRWYAEYGGVAVWVWASHARIWKSRREAQAKLMSLVLSGELAEMAERTVT